MDLTTRMDTAAREDRERFFKVADAMAFQPKYSDKTDEIESIKQVWRDMTDIEGYPFVDFPLALPDWFPKVYFASRWTAEEMLAELEKEKAEQEVTP